MMKRLVGGWCGALVLALTALMPTGSAQAAPDPYSPNVPTSCHIGTPAISVGKRVVLVIDVSSNSTTPLAGTVGLVLTRGPARAQAARPVAARTARPVWSTTVRFEGTPVRVVGPRLGKGAYHVRMTFTPDSGAFDGCVNTARLRVGANGPSPTGSSAGALPDTGGPHLAFLLLGAGLVAAGGGVLARSRRACGAHAAR